MKKILEVKKSEKSFNVIKVILLKVPILKNDRKSNFRGTDNISST